MYEATAFDWDELELYNQEERIAGLKQRVEELGGFVGTVESPGASPEVLEQFWRSVIRFEEKELGLTGALSLPPLQFPEPEGLADEEVHKVLWEKIRELIPYIRMQSNVRFIRSEIDKWVEERRFQPKSPKK